MPFADPDRLLTSPSYRFRASHWALLSGLDGGFPGPVTGQCDAVVMLNHLHPERLGFGARLAGALGCRLLVLCTASHAPAARAALTKRVRRPGAVDLLSLGWPMEFPLDALSCPRHPAARSPKHRDVAAKRTIALAVARARRWRHVLFLDDDVRGISAPQARTALGTLGADGVHAVGWTCPSFPDNSVVCHARRLAGLPQSTFLGSGALALDVTAGLPFFPPVYNEDWLFLYDVVARGQLRSAGEAGQLEFNPFESHERAREEEFGDILAEGLFHLLHEGIAEPETADQAFWRSVVDVRRQVVEDLRGRLRVLSGSRFGTTGTRRRHLVEALRSLDAAASEHTRSDLVPSLVSFTRTWRSDLAIWHDWFGTIEPADDVADALDRVGLPPGCLLSI